MPEWHELSAQQYSCPHTPDAQVRSGSASKTDRWMFKYRDFKKKGSMAATETQTLKPHVKVVNALLVSRDLQGLFGPLEREKFHAMKENLAADGTMSDVEAQIQARRTSSSERLRIIRGAHKTLEGMLKNEVEAATLDHLHVWIRGSVLATPAFLDVDPILETKKDTDPEVPHVSALDPPFHVAQVAGKARKLKQASELEKKLDLGLDEEEKAEEDEDDPALDRGLRRRPQNRFAVDTIHNSLAFRPAVDRKALALQLSYRRPSAPGSDTAGSKDMLAGRMQEKNSRMPSRDEMNKKVKNAKRANARTQDNAWCYLGHGSHVRKQEIDDAMNFAGGADKEAKEMSHIEVDLIAAKTGVSVREVRCPPSLFSALVFHFSLCPGFTPSYALPPNLLYTTKCLTSAMALLWLHRHVFSWASTQRPFARSCGKKRRGVE